jgi:hypothetical protein
VTLTLSVNLMSGKVVAETWVQNRVSGHEMRIERDEKVVPKEKCVFVKGETRRRTCYQMWKINLEICVVHVHNDVKWGNACTDLRGMYTPCLSHQVDIVCGDGNQSWCFHSKEHTRLNELMHWETVTQNLSMDSSTQWPVLKFHVTTKAYHSMIVSVWNMWTTTLGELRQLMEHRAQLLIGQPLTKHEHLNTVPLPHRIEDEYGAPPVVVWLEPLPLEKREGGRQAKWAINDWGHRSVRQRWASGQPELVPTMAVVTWFYPAREQTHTKKQLP